MKHDCSTTKIQIFKRTHLDHQFNKNLSLFAEGNENKILIWRNNAQKEASHEMCIPENWKMQVSTGNSEQHDSQQWQISAGIKV
mgnify:CR=1 FL=1